MFLDFEDYRPDTPRIDSALSRREGVLLSLVAHAVFVLLLIFVPKTEFFQASVEPVETHSVVEPDDEPLRFVEVLPLREMPAPPRYPAEQSDLDRRSSTVERAPEPGDIRPFSEGNTPEYILGGPEPEEAEGLPDSEPSPELLAEAGPSPLPADTESELVAPTPTEESAVASRAPGDLGDALRNLDRYLSDDVFDNRVGGQTEQSADIQFDSMGVDFGSWLLRFKRQVERNWIVPPAAMSFRGRTVIQFYVQRNGRIMDLRVVQPAQIPALTTSALNALKLSNPTANLPPEYPIDRAFFTVTFHYNEFYRDYP